MCDLKSYRSSCQELGTAGKSNQRMKYKIPLAARRQRIVWAGYSCSIYFYFYFFNYSKKTQYERTCYRIPSGTEQEKTPDDGLLVEIFSTWEKEGIQNKQFSGNLPAFCMVEKSLHCCWPQQPGKLRPSKEGGEQVKKYVKKQFQGKRSNVFSHLYQTLYYILWENMSLSEWKMKTLRQAL